MLDGIHAPGDYVVRRFSAEHVHGYWSSCVVRLVHGRADFFERIMIIAVVGDQLDQVRAVKNIFANRFADFLGAIRVVIFKTPERANLLRDAAALAAKGRDDFARGLYLGPDEPARVNR